VKVRVGQEAGVVAIFIARYRHISLLRKQWSCGGTRELSSFPDYEGRGVAKQFRRETEGISLTIDRIETYIARQNERSRCARPQIFLAIA
jgi:hypothetical protein